MDYQEFQKQVAEKIRDYLPKEFAESMITVNQVQKNNGVVWDALIIRYPGENTAPNIYLNGYYLRYQMGRPIGDILQEIAVERNERQRYGYIDVDALTDFEQIKDKIIFQVVGAENNQELLYSLPHRIEQDMALFYKVLAGKNEEGIETYTVTNSMQEYLGISEETLHELAMKNTPREFPILYHSVNDMVKEEKMQEIIEELLEDSEDEEFAEFIKGMAEDAYEQMGVPEIPMYVLTNEELFHGAAALFYPGVKEMLAEEFGSNFFVLPSSIHETIIVPDNGMLDYRALKDMVNDVNEKELSAWEVLTGEVYYYDRKTKELSIAGAKQERETEKEGASIADKLLRKQEQIKKEMGFRSPMVPEMTM